MIGRIMKHEWKLLTREKLLYFAIPVYAFLIAYSVSTGAQWKSFLGGNVAEAVALADQMFENAQKKLDWIESGARHSIEEDPRFAARMARYQTYEMAAKPPSSTAAIAIGQSDVQPSYLKVQWKPMFHQTSTDEIENPTNLAIGLIDLSFVLIYLYPLLIIALSFNILSSERENGTQALLLSQPVSVAQFVLGKILLRGAIIIGLAAGLSLAGLLISSPEIIASGDLWRAGSFEAVVMAYGVFWFGLAVVVNAFPGKSSTNALVLMGAWLTFVLIVPAGLNLAAKAIYPLPSRIEMIQALRRGDAVVKQAVGYQRPYQKELLGRSQEEVLETTISDFYLTLLPLEQQAEAVAAPIFQRFEAQRRSQQLLAERLKYISPAVITQFTLQEIANQSADNFHNFNQQVQAFHQGWRDYFLPIVMANRMMTRQEMLAVPRFTYEPAPDLVVFARTFKNFLALALFAGAALLPGFWLLKRYQAAAR